MSIFTKILGRASGLNWWKYGAYAVVLAALIGGSYFKGKHDCEIDVEKEKTAQVEEDFRRVTGHVISRVPVVQEREVASAKQAAEIERLSKELRDATQKRPENPSCDLSDAEFNLMQELAGKTRASK